MDAVGEERGRPLQVHYVHGTKFGCSKDPIAAAPQTNRERETATMSLKAAMTFAVLVNTFRLSTTYSVSGEIVASCRSLGR